MIDDERDDELDDILWEPEYGNPVGLMLHGPHDGSIGPRPTPDLRCIVVSSRPDLRGDRMVIYSKCGDFWIFDRYMLPHESPMELVFGVKE